MIIAHIDIYKTFLVINRSVLGIVSSHGRSLIPVGLWGDNTLRDTKSKGPDVEVERFSISLTPPQQLPNNLKNQQKSFLIDVDKGFVGNKVKRTDETVPGTPFGYSTVPVCAS